MDAHIYETQVCTGKALEELTTTVAHYRPRYCYTQLKKFMLDKNDFTHVCALYGLRRTGKTVMALQVLRELANTDFTNVAYFELTPFYSMDKVIRDLERLHVQGVEYVCIDEVTAVKYFLELVALLPDKFARLGMRIVLAGTDSYVLWLAQENPLFQRLYTIHTTYMSYKEFDDLLGPLSVQDYISKGGTLDSTLLENVDGYVNTAIAENLQHSLRHSDEDFCYHMLYNLYAAGELTNVINRLVADMNHRFTIEVITRSFKASGLLLSIKNLSRRGVDVSGLDIESVTTNLVNRLSIVSWADLKCPVQQEHLDKLYRYLVQLDVVADCYMRVIGGTDNNLVLFTQPGLRYQQTVALLNSLEGEPSFQSLPLLVKEALKSKALDTASGLMLEDIILYETKRALGESYQVFKLRKEGTDSGEFDMVVYKSNTHSCSLYEIKHSDKRDPAQTRHLENVGLVKLVGELYAPVKERCVLYRGPTCREGHISYINVEEYLKRGVWLEGS